MSLGELMRLVIQVECFEVQVYFKEEAEVQLPGFVPLE
jgi:hypothetical protein